MQIMAVHGQIQAHLLSVLMAKLGAIRKLFLIAVVASTCASPLLGQDSRVKDVSVVAYNVHLLPKVALKVAGKRSNSEYRSQAIAERLAQFDILGISEAFDPAYSRTLIAGLEKQSGDELSIVKGPGRTGRHLIGSGLLIASRFPVVETHTITYSHASRFVTSGFKADGFAAKGALHVRLQLFEDSQAYLDCFLTHLESRSQEARGRQIEQFAEFVADQSQPQVPLILLGDFNIEAAPEDPESQYQTLLAALYDSNQRLMDAGHNVTKGPKGTSNAITEDGGRRIDYIFLSENPASSKVRLELLQTQHLRLIDEKVKEGSLSDHLAVKSVMRAECWKNRKSTLRTPQFLK